jgi:hypothetical protein
MRLMIGVLVISFVAIAGVAFAEEPFQPQITLQELGQQCANSIGRFHVELQVAGVQAAKYQAEIARLQGEVAKVKDTKGK